MSSILLILLSAVFFALSTVFAKFVSNSSEVSSAQITFVRFFIGFIAASYIVKKKKRSIIPHKIHLIIYRSIFNTFAVLLFFIGVKDTTITNANMLNMTYPVFVVLLAPFINKEKISKISLLYLFLSVAAIYLISSPDFSYINRGDAWSLLSAILAAVAVTALRESRKYDSTSVILFYHMGIGTVIMLCMMPFLWKNCSVLNWFNIVVSGILGVAGQYALTIGIKKIDAASSSIISSSRILWAIIFGVIFFSEKLSLNIIIGAILLTISLIGISGGITYIKNKIIFRRS